MKHSMIEILPWVVIDVVDDRIWEQFGSEIEARSEMKRFGLDGKIFKVKERPHDQPKASGE